MTEKDGGTNAGPNPGVLGRAALGSCLALGYGMWAARLDVPITALEVEIHADYDVRGELGVDDGVRPGYSAIRYVVRVSSPAPEADVRRVIDTADRYSSWRRRHRQSCTARARALHRHHRVTRWTPSSSAASSVMDGTAP